MVGGTYAVYLDTTLEWYFATQRETTYFSGRGDLLLDTTLGDYLSIQREQTYFP